MKKLMSKAMDLYRPFWGVMAFLFALMLASQALALLSPYFFGKVVDTLSSGEPMETVLALALATMGVHLLNNSVLHYVQMKTEVNRIDFDAERHIEARTLNKVLAFSIGQHTSEHSGIRQSVIKKGEHSLKTLTYSMLYELIPLGLKTSLTIAALLWMSWDLGLIVLAGVLLFIAISVRINHSIKNDLERVEDEFNGLAKTYSEILRNVRLVIASAREEKTAKEYYEAVGKTNDLGKKLWSKYVLLASLRGAIPGIVMFAVTALGAMSCHQGEQTVGSLVMFLMWTSSAIWPLGMFGGIHRRLMMVSASVKKYFQLLDMESEIKMPENPVRQERFSGRIEFCNVSFEYPARKFIEDNENETADSSQRDSAKRDALRGVNFTIENGMTTAFVGPSGAGKSTIVNLLLRAYDPDKGQIKVDGNDLRSLDPRNFRDKIGLVDQEVALFDRTLRENITFGLNDRAKNVTDEELSRVARASCVDKFYPRLERGFDTLIGEKGVKLSGGERQRVGIARALIKDPDILIFDEATSNLDAENEAMIRDSIRDASKGRTTIIIAHRLSTVRDADKIIVLDDGRVAGEGMHDELMDSCEIYRRLVVRQMKGAEVHFKETEAVIF